MTKGKERINLATKVKYLTCGKKDFIMFFDSILDQDGVQIYCPNDKKVVVMIRQISSRRGKEKFEYLFNERDFEVLAGDDSHYLFAFLKLLNLLRDYTPSALCF